MGEPRFTEEGQAQLKPTAREPKEKSSLIFHRCPETALGPDYLHARTSPFRPAPRRLLMIVIRRLIDRRRAYTAIFLPGVPARIFPTSDQEHARILQIYKQDRPHEGIHNDFTDFHLSRPATVPPPVRRTHP